MELMEFAKVAQQVRFVQNAYEQVQINYYWYHHMMDSKLREDIQDAINSGNFETFKMYYRMLNTKDICYLPDTAAVFFGDECLGDISVLNEQGFAMIMHAEYECG